MTKGNDSPNDSSGLGRIEFATKLAKVKSELMCCALDKFKQLLEKPELERANAVDHLAEMMAWEAIKITRWGDI